MTQLPYPVKGVEQKIQNRSFEQFLAGLDKSQARGFGITLWM